MKKISWLGLLCAAAMSVTGADRTPDGYGLVEAYSATSVDNEAFPFRYEPSVFSGGNLGTASTHAIDCSGTNAWAPQKIYQLERYSSNITITFPNLTPGAQYKLEIHTAENYYGGSNSGGVGSRVWHVYVNDAERETDIDIYVQAGGAYKALAKQYECTADANGTVRLKLVAKKDNARFGGLAIFGKTAPAKPSFTGSVTLGDVNLRIGGSSDVHRYYVERSTTGAEGPWTSVAEPLVAETRELTLPSAHDGSSQAWYRVVASNGVGVVTSDTVFFDAQTATDYLATTGSTVANSPDAVYGITTIGAPGAGANTLAGDSVTATGYVLDVDGDSTLLLGNGQVFTLGMIGIGNNARTLTVDGAGTLAAKDGKLTASAKNVGGNILVKTATSGVGASDVLANNGAGTVTFAGPVSGFGSILINSGTLAVSNNTDATLCAPLSGVGNFVKSGSAVLTVDKANPDFAGDAIVREGTLRFGATGSLFANASGAIRIENGGTLDVAAAGLANEKVNLGIRKVVAEGAGVDGKGAIVSGCNSSQYNSLQNGELSGDVVFGGGGATLSETVGRWDFRSGSLNMNGHNIRKVGKNMVCLTGVELSGLTGVTIDVDEGYWSSETSTSYSGGSQNVFNIAGGAYLDFYQIANPLTWTLNLADGATVQVRSGTAAQNRFTGPVNLAEGSAILLAKADATATLEGSISGPGKFISRSAAAGRVTLSNPTNTYTGGTVIEGGDLGAKYKGSLPGYDNPTKLEINGATLIVELGDGEGNNWGSDDVRAFSQRGQLTAANSYVGLEVPSGIERTFDGSLTIPMGCISKYGDGMLKFENPVTLDNGKFTQFAGTTTFGGGADYWFTNGINEKVGTTIIRDNVKIVTPIKGGDITIGNVTRNTAHMIVENATMATKEEVPDNVATAGIRVGYGSNNNWENNSARGILEVRNGAVISNLCTMGQGFRAQGAIWQTGGRFVNCGGRSNDIRIGYEGYGYLEISGGYHEWMGYGQVGSQGASASGVFVQHGGEFQLNQKHVGRFGINRGANGGKGEVYLDGGDFHVIGGELWIGENDNYRGGRAWMTVDGTANAVVDVCVDLCNRTNAVGILNLNGGVLATPYMTTRSRQTANFNTAKAYVNFNGGTFKCLANGEIFKSAANNRPDAVTIYAGGATFDTAGKNATIAVPLEKPAGKGIASITVPNLSDYIGSPVFTITGDGAGASAHAVFNKTTGKVTGVKITSPGTGYTTATVTSTDGGWTNIVNCTAALADNAATGGITKKGAGTLTLSAANTFGGAVTVEDGTLVIGAAGAFPEGNDLNLTGGIIVGNGATITAGVVRVTSGGLVNVKIVCDSFEKTGDGVLSMGNSEIKSKSGMVLTNGNVLLGGLPGLRFGQLAGASNWTEQNPCESYSLNLAKAELASSATYGENVTYVYSGYIWNRTDETATWTFASNFDDYVRIWVDAELVLDQTNCWAGAKGSVTVTPGSHLFEVRVSNGTGPGGRVTGNSTYNWDVKPPAFGVAVDFQGRNEWKAANYVIPADPGDGSLFSTEAQLNEQITLENVTTSDVEISGNLALKGTWTVDAAALAAGGCADVMGSFDFSQVERLNVSGGEELEKKSVTLVRATGGFTGDVKTLFALIDGLSGNNWSLAIVGNELRLVYSVGTTIFIR